ncbi:MAG: NPCBM/NEW2 domain-containing protein [Phycisphaerae bacterium]|nr:NPCBM/NEW2 domain-containing protein [Phycisphaerae bacterium]
MGVVAEILSRRRIWSLALAFAWSAPARGEVTVRTIDPVQVQGRLIRFTLNGHANLKLADGREVTIPTEEIVRISTSNSDQPPPVADAEFILAGGDHLYGRVVGRGVEAVEIESASAGTLRAPLEGLREIRLRPAISSRALGADVPDKQTTKETDDRIRLTNGDELRGLVVSVDSAGVTIEGPRGADSIPWSVIQFLRMSGLSTLRMPLPLAIVTTVHGERLTCRSLVWSEDNIEAEHVAGFRVSISAQRVARVDLIGGRWQWLGELEPVSFDHTPMLGISWPYRVNQNALGEPILVDGETYDRGIGVHSRTSLIYELKSEYREFVTALGLDDRSGPFADVSAYILVDGVRKYAETGLRPGRLIGPVRVDVRRANRIELIVDYGKNGDIQDRFNWVEAGLVRTAPGD